MLAINFIVDLPPDRRVGVLLEEVKKKKGPVHIPDNIPADALIPGNQHDTGAALSLDPGAELQEYFTEPPPYKVVHVVIQLPSEQSLADGELDPLQVEPEAEYDTYDGLIDYMSTSRYVLDAPSTVSKPNVFREYQKTEDRILNDRPCTDSKFADDLDSEKVPPTNPRKFQLAVDTFASVMCRHFRDKEVRRMAVLGALNGIFRSYEPFSLPLIVPDTIAGERVSDGHANGPAQVMETVVGFEDNTDPEIQNTSCYLQMNDSQMRLGTHKKSFEKYLCPALGISIIGSNIGFGALLLLDRARYVGLTPKLSTHSPSGGNFHRPTLFRAFLAACTLRTSIHKDTRRVLYNTLTLPRIRDRYLPCIQKISAVSCQDDGAWNKDRFMYLAKMRHRKYWSNSLLLCRETPCAELLGYGTVPGGWHVVVMEFIKHDQDNHIKYAPKHWAKWNKTSPNLCKTSMKQYCRAANSSSQQIDRNDHAHRL
ncbi:hypothetical protein BJV77DRAFT_1008779 [Russula vinacea]|nr:hypothetical protein BJV77DRAFT_1008779 [Russula vinacea]